MKYLLIFLVLITLFFTNTFHVSAYSPVSTHAGLTEQIVEFYNLSGAKAISNDDMELMVQASITEDFLTRPLNHFYDPIRKIGINGARSSKVWALDGNVVENDFSWPKVIQAYAEGRDTEAVIGLGHILHLIEDLSVPDHTRNDPHKGEGLGNGFTGESPYEKWTDGAKNRKTLAGLARVYSLGGSKIHHFFGLGEAFDFLANYSNHNFFSRDSITNSIYAYSNPLMNDGDGLYLYSLDNLNNDRHKILKIDRDKETGKIEYVLVTDNDKSVLSSYFDRLAKQAVLTGAGVIELFFKEGEKARAEYKIAQAKAAQEEIAKNEALAKSLASKGYLGLAVAGAGILWNQYVSQPIVNTSTKITGTIARGATSATQEATHYSAFLFSSGAIGAQQGKEALVVEANKVKETIASSVSQIGTIIRQTISGAIDTNSQVASAAQLLIAVDKPTTVVPATKIVEPVAVIASPVPPVTINSIEFVVTPRLSSGGGGAPRNLNKVEPSEEVAIIATTSSPATGNMLFAISECAQSFVFDVCAVATTTLSLSWQASTSPEYFQITLSGSQNEIATTTEIHTQALLSGDGEYTFLIEAYENATSSIAYASSTQSVFVIQNPVVINEIAWSGTTASSSDQWIELYNSSAHTIDLSKIDLVFSDSDFVVNLSGTIAPRGYFLLERGSDQVVQDVSADLIYEATSTSLLPDTWSQLSLVWNDNVIDQTPEMACEDFGEGRIFCLGWTAGQSGYQVLSMERFSPTVTGTDMHSWRSNLRYLSVGNDSAGNSIFGTPRAKNSTSYLINGGYDIETPVTLTAENGPYIIDNGGFAVHSSGSLTIESGVVIKVYGGSSLYAYGPLYINGTVENPVIFTKLTDIGVASEIPLLTDHLSSTSRFDMVTLYSGSEGSIISNVHLRSVEDGFLFNDTSATLDGLYISDADHAVTIDGGQVSMGNLQIENIDRDAIDVYDGEMTLRNSGILGVSDGDAIGLYNSSSTINNTSVVDIGDGSALGMYDSYATITESSFRDGTDSGIELYSSILHLASSTVSLFEGTGVAGYSSSLTLSGVTIFENGIGVDFYTSTASVTLSNIFSNTEYGVYNGGPGAIEAVGNWWGDLTGPYHEIDNPTGLGDSIYGQVDFSGWLLERI